MKPTNIFQLTIRQGLCLAVILTLCGAVLSAQTPPPAAVLLTPDQLDDLVAPIALYPDPLLGQALAASTYPLELVEAQQWLQQNRNLSGAALMDATRQQNWDPSVQALVAFPDVLSLLNRDIQWTTDLGNAYLAQQNEVMAAVQRMRARAQQNGRLATTPQETVTTQTQNGQSAIVIEPANPQVIYVPTYNPEYIWGPPVWGVYPPLWYPAIGFGFGFGPGIYLTGFFPGWGVGWGGWGVGWGWGCGWFSGGLYVNNFFLNHYGFHGYFHDGFQHDGRVGWEHDPYHRAGIRYANANVAARYNNQRFAEGRVNAGMRSGFNGARSYTGNVGRGFSGAPAARGFTPNQPGAGNGNRGFAGERSVGPNDGRGVAPNSGQGFSHGPAPSMNHGFQAPANRGAAPSQNRSFTAPSVDRSFVAPTAHSFAATNMNRNFAAPANHSFSGSNVASHNASAPRASGGFSRASGGGRSFGGGGHSSGGGGGGHSGHR